MFRKLMVAVIALELAGGVVAFGTPAQAQALKAGIMTCNVAGGFGFIFGSSRAVNCTFAPGGAAPQRYVGAINKFGVDIGYVEGAVMAWAVLAPTNNPGPGLLAGTYVGATGGEKGTSKRRRIGDDPQSPADRTIDPRQCFRDLHGG